MGFAKKISPKTAVTVYTQGHPDTAGFGAYLDMTDRGIGMLFEDAAPQRIVGAGMASKDDARGNAALMEHSYKAGKGLVGGDG